MRGPRSELPAPDAPVAAVSADLAHEGRGLATSLVALAGMATAPRALMKRVRRVALGPIAVLLVACGGRLDATPSASPDGATSATDAGTVGAVSDALVGQLLVTTEAFDGQLLERFSADLQPLPAPTPFACPGATARVGACCVFPPIPPIPSPAPGSGTGAANLGTNAGALALFDATSRTNVGTFDFGTGGYAGLPANYYATRWQPGDVLSVSAAGARIGAFTVSAPALSPPIVQLPPSLVATQDLKITWLPDPNAETMAIQIIDNDAGSVAIACSAPDSDGTFTVDASLFAAFKSGDLCEGAAYRETVRYAQTPTGRVALKSFGYGASFRASVK